MGQDSVQTGTFWGFLNVRFAPLALGLDIVDQMCVQLRMGFTIILSGYILGENIFFHPEPIKIRIFGP